MIETSPIPVPTPTVPTGTGGDDCTGPYSIEYPTCESKITYVMDERPDEWLSIRGLERERCSIQSWYSLVERGRFCPPPAVSATDVPVPHPTAAPPVTPTGGGDDCMGPYATEYPKCESKITYVMDVRPDSWLLKRDLIREWCSIQTFYRFDCYTLYTMPSYIHLYLPIYTPLLYAPIPSCIHPYLPIYTHTFLYTPIPTV